MNDYPINKGGKVDALRDGSKEYFTGEVTAVHRDDTNKVVSVDIQLKSGETERGVAKSCVLSIMSKLRNYQRYCIYDEDFTHSVKKIDNAILHWKREENDTGDVKRRRLVELQKASSRVQTSENSESDDDGAVENVRLDPFRHGIRGRVVELGQDFVGRDWLAEATLKELDRKSRDEKEGNSETGETKISLLILTSQHEPTICSINTQKQILEMKIYLTASI